jgi:pimeloyl-ACP methyl ester carboxylesterase
MFNDSTLAFENIMDKIIQHLESNISYSIEGTGDVLVLLHGFCEDKNVWDEFKQPLLFNKKIICIDLPGFGKSLSGKNHTSVELMAEAVLAVLNAEQIEKCFLLGHSMGGYVVLAFAENYSDRLKGLGLFHSSCFADDDAKKENRKKVAEFVLQSGSKTFAHQLFPTLFAPEFAIENAALINSLEEIAATYPPESIANASLAMGNRPDRSNVLKETPLPVLIIFGKKDLAIPLEKSLMMLHLPDTANICQLELSAHMGMFEEPEKSREAIEVWMKMSS